MLAPSTPSTLMLTAMLRCRALCTAASSDPAECVSISRHRAEGIDITRVVVVAPALTGGCPDEAPGCTMIESGRAS